MDNQPRTAQQLTAFLCHGSPDKPAVIKLYDALVDYGVKPWLDAKDLVPGQKWRPKIVKAVRECDIVIVCLTRSSISRQGFLHKEIAEALDAAEEKPEDSIYVIPLRLEDCDVPERLREWHWVNYHEPDGHANLLRALAIKAEELGRAQPHSRKQPAEAPAQMLKPVVAPSSISNAESERLIRTIEDASASVKDRIAAGRRLAEIGDPRPGVGLRHDGSAPDWGNAAQSRGLPDIVWCDVPAGEFIYQNGGKRTLPAFRISKHLVTYRQFQSFIDAPDGFRNAEWWNGLHTGGIKQQLGGPGDQAFKFDNHPRERVSWYDAMAFCRWLSAKLGYGVTLPTEQQWEKASRGTDGRIYPYGNEFDPAKGNTIESGIGQTSAVGAFPHGASPYGVMDLSGNVWEWTLTEYDSGETGDLGSDGRRVLRGGSWSDYQYGARAACRDNGNPDLRYDDIGFRLASPAKTSEILNSDS